MIGEETKSYILIHKLKTHEEKIQKINKENSEIISMITREKGAKNIIEKIIALKKPIVGHNCFIDLLFLMSHFMDDIPKNFKTYKIKLKNEFSGGIFDTKYLYNESNLNFNGNKIEAKSKNNLNLGSLYTNLKEENKKLEKEKQINIQIPKNENFIDYLDENNGIKFHQADYDSFTTGCAFLYMSNILGDEFIGEHKNKLNCYHGLYSCYDIDNTESNDKLVGNSTDSFILIFNEKYFENKEIMIKINEEILNSKLINCKFNVKEIGGAVIVLLNTENKNDFMKLCSNYQIYFQLFTVEAYKESLKNKKK